MIADAARILRIADRLNVEVVLKPDYIPAPFGPQGHACDVRTRKVYVNDETCKEPLSHPEHVAYVLHEIMHVYLQPPWWNIFDVPEEMVLLQAERTIARASLSRESYKHVIEYQEMTVTYSSGGLDEIGTLGYYRNSAWWRRGFEVGRVLSVLTDGGRATYATPEWDRIAKVRGRIRNYFGDPDRKKWPLS